MMSVNIPSRAFSRPSRRCRTRFQPRSRKNFYAFASMNLPQIVSEACDGDEDLTVPNVEEDHMDYIQYGYENSGCNR